MSQEYIIPRSDLAVKMVNEITDFMLTYSG